MPDTGAEVLSLQVCKLIKSSSHQGCDYFSNCKPAPWLTPFLCSIILSTNLAIQAPATNKVKELQKFPLPLLKKTTMTTH